MCWCHDEGNLKSVTEYFDYITNETPVNLYTGIAVEQKLQHDEKSVRGVEGALKGAKSNYEHCLSETFCAEGFVVCQIRRIRLQFLPRAHNIMLNQFRRDTF